jgi:hypothetical protein
MELAGWVDNQRRRVFAFLQPASKTPEERVTAEAAVGGYYSLYKIDGEIVAQERIKDALVAALKESEAHNG